MTVWQTLFSKKQDNFDSEGADPNIDPKHSQSSDSDFTSSSFSITFTSKYKLFKLYKLSNPSDDSDHVNIYCNLSKDNFSFEESEELRTSLETYAAQRLEQAYDGKSPDPIEDLDEDAFVYISSDKMFSLMLLFPPIGDGKVLSSSEILQILIDSGVSFGLDFDLIYSLPSSVRRHFCFFLIAQGKEPQDGKDGYIVELYHRELYMHAEQSELNHAEYARLNLGKKIKKNGVICEIIPPTVGISGITVTRELLLPLPKAGEPATIPQGRNTCQSKGGRYLIAEKDGNVAYSGGCFHVKPVLEISHNVKAAGEQHDINFLGDVHIHGDVGSEITIRATGDVYIDGIAESCKIEATENVIIVGGVQGQHNAVIRAHKGVYARYLEHCTVYAQDIVQANCIIDCNIYSNGTVTARTGLGAIVCGTVRSSKMISANTVGSKAEVKTDIIIGGFPCDEADKEEILSELENITKNIASLSSKPKSTENDTALSKLRLNQCVAKMKLDKFEKDLEAYHLSIHKNDTRSLKCNKIYPGVCVAIDAALLKVDREREHCLIGKRGSGSLDFLDIN